MSVGPVRLGASSMCLAGLLSCQTPPRPAAQDVAADSAAVAMVVEGFHVALARGDSSAALAFLMEDAVILEGGGIETLEEYRSGHMGADMAFAGGVDRNSSAIVVRVLGDVAWATSTNTTNGEFRGRTINSRGAELAVLTRQEDGWKIRAVQWSSRARRPG